MLLRRGQLSRNKAPMKFTRFLLSICVAAYGLAALSMRADDSSTQTPPPAGTSSTTKPSEAESKAQAKARKEAEKKAKAEAEAQKKAEAKARKEAEAKAKAEQSKPAPTAPKAQADKKAPAFKPIERPSLSIAADKEQRLTELLQKYKAEEIAPEQYHKERAKILAEP
jgi:hypothetical protein